MDTSTILIKSKLTASLFFSRNPKLRNCIQLINKTLQCRCATSSSLRLYLWSRRKPLLQSDESQSLCLPHVWRPRSSCFLCDVGSSSAACSSRNPAGPQTHLISPSKSNILFKQIHESAGKAAGAATFGKWLSSSIRESRLQAFTARRSTIS